MIDRFIQSIKRHGLFDVVICDAVINSVNSQEAEDAVMGCLNTFCKPGGKILLSGRRREDIEGRYNYKKAATIERYIHFPDTNGLSAILREGQWYFQKFLYEAQVDAIIAKNNLLPSTGITLRVLRCRCDKNQRHQPEDMIKSIDFEFDLDLPNNQRYGRQNEVKELLRLM
jgi:ParB family chromosome partitioning protein